MRLFTAIDLSPEMREKLAAFLAKLRPLAKLRWSPVENLHITTKFIGEWPEARIEEMKTALATVKGEAIRISVRGLGWFPSTRRPHSFWTGVHGGEALLKLAAETDRATARIGVAVETRVFSPHLTLARINSSAPVAAIESAAGDPDFGAFQATCFFLYLSSNGKYSKLAEFSLPS